MAPQKPKHDDEGRECFKCHVFKTWSQFYEDPTGFLGHRGNCKDCDKKRHRKNRQLSRGTTLLRLYGLSGLEFEIMMREQGGLCKICKQKMMKPCVDHCHSTGKIRGILCDACNRGIACFKDNGQFLLAAAEYLK